MEWRRELAEEHSSVRPYLVLVRARFSVAVRAKAVQFIVIFAVRKKGSWVAESSVSCGLRFSSFRSHNRKGGLNF
jgi:hypothetical protein